MTNLAKQLCRTSSSFLLTSYFFLSSAFAAGPTVCPSYTFVGRITDNAHVAFDADRVATFTAAADDGTLLARAKTFFRDDSTRNYALQIPMASDAVPGCALLGDTVSVSVTDPMGKKWSAVIDPAVVGTPGGVSVVDIVLAEDADGDGIDDALFAELEAGWEASPFWKAAAAYDPRSDSDGDGVSDLDEALLGTHPFNPGDALAITDFDPVLQSVSFQSAGGRSYSIQQSTDMTDWAPVGFSTDSAAPAPTRSFLSVPSAATAATHTLYLFPTSSPAFFRLSVQ